MLAVTFKNNRCHIQYMYHQVLAQHTFLHTLAIATTVKIVAYFIRPNPRYYS